MNSCCTLFQYTPDELPEPINIDELGECETGCVCHCGYIQYESLAPYLSELSDKYTDDESHNLLEAKLRQQIVQVSRLFDTDSNAPRPGYYGKSHTRVVKLVSNGSRYLKIDPFVKGSLELYTENGYLINSHSYIYQNGFLVINPCRDHMNSCGCTQECGIYSPQVAPQGWKGCLIAKAQFGMECQAEDVKLAVQMYILELNTYGDVKETNYQGLPISRGFKVPDVWIRAINGYRNLNSNTSRFAIA